MEVWTGDEKWKNRGQIGVFSEKIPKSGQCLSLILADKYQKIFGSDFFQRQYPLCFPRKPLIGAKSEHISHLLRYRSLTPIIGATKGSAYTKLHVRMEFDSGVDPTCYYYNHGLSQPASCQTTLILQPYQGVWIVSGVYIPTMSLDLKLFSPNFFGPNNFLTPFFLAAMSSSTQL